MSGMVSGEALACQRVWLLMDLFNNTDNPFSFLSFLRFLCWSWLKQEQISLILEKAGRAQRTPWRPPGLCSWRFCSQGNYLTRVSARSGFHCCFPYSIAGLWRHPESAPLTDWPCLRLTPGKAVALWPCERSSSGTEDLSIPWSHALLQQVVLPSPQVNVADLTCPNILSWGERPRWNKGFLRPNLSACCSLCVPLVSLCLKHHSKAACSRTGPVWASLTDVSSTVLLSNGLGSFGPALLLLEQNFQRGVVII